MMVGIRPLGLSLRYHGSFCSRFESLMCRYSYGRPISSRAMEIFQPFGVSEVNSSITSASVRCRLRHAVVGAANDIGADLVDVLSFELRTERDHAIRLQRAVVNDALPKLRIAQRFGVTQVRHDTCAHRGIAMAGAAVVVVERLARGD